MVREVETAVGQRSGEHLVDGEAARREIGILVARITKGEIAAKSRFREHFVSANAIPHATVPLPHLAAAVTLPALSFNTGGDREGGRRRRRG